MSLAPLFQVIVCGLICNQEGKILLAKRGTQQKLAGMWEFPGGKLEKNESLEQALKREIREELHIEINITELLTIQPYHYPHADVLILFYLCEQASGILKCTDHEEIKWLFPREILQHHDVLPANIEAIKRCEQALKNTSTDHK